MKVLLFIAAIVSLCSVGLTATVSGFFKNATHPGKCVYDNVVLSPGDEAKLPGQCASLLCGANSFGTIQTCGVTSAPKGCEYTDYINVDAPYSECCEKKLVC